MSINARKIYIRININIGYLPIGIQYKSTIPGQFQIPTDLLQNLFTLMIEIYIYCTTIDCKGNFRTCVTREADQHFYDAAVVKTNTDRNTILILDLSYRLRRCILPFSHAVVKSQSTNYTIDQSRLLHFE